MFELFRDCDGILTNWFDILLNDQDVHDTLDEDHLPIQVNTQTSVENE